MTTEQDPKEREAVLTDLEIDDAEVEDVKGGMSSWPGLRTRPSPVSLPALSTSLWGEHPTPMRRTPGLNPKLDTGIKK